MQYYFELWGKDPFSGKQERLNNYDRFEEIKSSELGGAGKNFVKVFKAGVKLLNGNQYNYDQVGTIVDAEDLELWRERFERDAAWKPHDPIQRSEGARFGEVPPIAAGVGVGKTTSGIPYGERIVDHIDPKHYQDRVRDMQYIQIMDYLLKRRTGLEALTYGMIYKYLFRSGEKDPVLQDELKALWYLKYQIAWRINGCQEVAPEDVDSIIEKYLKG